MTSHAGISTAVTSTTHNTGLLEHPVMASNWSNNDDDCNLAQLSCGDYFQVYSIRQEDLGAKHTAAAQEQHHWQHRLLGL